MSVHVGVQGGRFDHADRLFHDIAATWENCLQSSSDVKELVPEFFYQADFLLNSNSFHLGTRQVSITIRMLRIIMQEGEASLDGVIQLETGLNAAGSHEGHLWVWRPTMQSCLLDFAAFCSL